MKLNKIILIAALFLTFPITVFAAQPVPDFRLNIAINQTIDFTLTLNNIGLEAGPSVNYGLNYPSNFYLIKVVDKNNAELFSGKTLKSYQTLPPEFTTPDPSFTSEIIIPNQINLYLPYFNEAAKIQLFDENNALKLEIILADHNLQGLKYRYSACDLCGYCPPTKASSSWEKCRQCLYPNASKNPSTGDTLKVSDPASNSGPTPFPGKAYTAIGCIGSAPESVAQAILNIIFSIAGGLAFIYLLYGAFIVATSQAEPDRLNYGRRLVKGAIIGLIVTLVSAFLFNFIASTILRIPGFG